jgi:peptidoglycan hydrolase-like protein with peptidoglycan-binding domain
MSFESGFNPKAENRYSGATGLIQWMPPNFPVPNLRDLSAEQQLPYAIAWFKARNLSRLGASATPTDYYLSVFLPAFTGYAADTVLGRKGSGDVLRLANGKSTGLTLSKMYEQNPAFDSTGKGYYTVGDVGAKIEKLVAGAQGRAPVPVPLPVMSPPRPRTAADIDTFSPGSPSRPHRPVLSARIGSSRTVMRAAEPAALPPLVRGDHGPAVLLLQQLLNVTMAETEDATVELDGEFGAQTELWVALHQIEASLEPDGQCGPLTWRSFTDPRFWGPDRIGRQAHEDPYGDGPPLPKFPIGLAETVVAPPTTRRAQPKKKASSQTSPPSPASDTAAPFELRKQADPEPPTKRSR